MKNIYFQGTCSLSEGWVLQHSLIMLHESRQSNAPKGNGINFGQRIVFQEGFSKEEIPDLRIEEQVGMVRGRNSRQRDQHLQSH